MFPLTLSVLCFLLFGSFSIIISSKTYTSFFFPQCLHVCTRDYPQTMSSAFGFMFLLSTHILFIFLNSTGYLLSLQGEHNRIASSQPVPPCYLVNILSPLPRVFPLHSATSSLACLSPFTLHFTHVICQSSLIHAFPVTRPL